MGCSCDSEESLKDDRTGDGGSMMMPEMRDVSMKRRKIRACVTRFFLRHAMPEDVNSQHSSLKPHNDMPMCRALQSRESPTFTSGSLCDETEPRPPKLKGPTCA